MGIATFIPEVWSKQVLSTLRKSLVYGDVVNRDYEGEIANQGDTVRINTIGRPTIGDYIPNVTVITPEQVQSAEQVLVVDKAKFFSFAVDDVDQRQANGDMISVAMDESAFGLADVADQIIASLYTGIPATSDVGAGAAVAITSADLAYKNLVAARTLANQLNMPAEGRYAILPPWYVGWLLQDNRFIANPALSTAGGNLLNGVVGRAAGFDIRESNNVPLISGDDYACTFGVRSAISFAQQINKVEAYRPQSGFSDAVKGLHVYGTKIVRPDAIVLLRASMT